MLKKVIILIFLSFYLLNLSANVKAGGQLYLCEGVNKIDCSPYGINSSFPHNSEFYFYFTLSEPVGNYPQIVYCIYQVNSNGEQVYSFSLTQDVKSNWEMFYYPVTIFYPGRYNVFIYPKYSNGQYGNMLVSGTFIIK